MSLPVVVAAPRSLPHFNATAAALAATSTASALTTGGGGPSKDGIVERNPYALVLALIPMLTIFGNSMVILAVRREKSLQTVTNYLIVSLASADLLVATCVMFFAVYFEWNSFVWDLGPTLCNLYIGADVACSTASILNLLAISIDRYIAISHPLAYCQIGTKNSRAYLSIALVWSVSIAVAVPVAFGANHIEQEHECSFTNPVFMISSSLLSFFVPCLAMIALYAVIFRRLREREKARDMRKRRPTLGVDNALILNALMGGARMARQIAKSHLKDQLLLELSMQTSSFPSPSEEEEEEEEEEEDDDQSESEGSSQRRHHHHKVSSSRPVSSNHKLSSSVADPNRRPTFCLMLNGAAGGMPFFPLAPMNPLTLPISGMDGADVAAGKRPRRPSRHRRQRAAALVLRRCNTLPSAVLRRPMPTMMRRMGSRERGEEAEGVEGRGDGREDGGEEKRPMLAAEVNNNEVMVPMPSMMPSSMAGGMFLMESVEMLDGIRPCSESASQFSLRDCSPSSSFWRHGHDDELSTTRRSFGDGLQEDLPFIDNPSSPSIASSSSSSDAGSGSTSSMDEDGRKWSRSAMTDPMAARARRRLALEGGPKRAHSSYYCGWPEEAVGEVVAEGRTTEEKEDEKEEDEKEDAEEARREGVKVVPITLIQLASPVHATASAHSSSAALEGPHPPVRRISTAVGPRLSLLLCPAPGSCQSLPNLLNECAALSRLGSPIPNAGFLAENCTTKPAATIGAERSSTMEIGDGHRSGASIGSRSVRIASGGTGTNANAVHPSSRSSLPPPLTPSSADAVAASFPQRNGSCPRSGAKSSSHQSPLQRIRNAFRRSLLAAMDEKRRPSRQLLKRATKQMRREQKATVTLAVVLAVFLCCWVPFFALHLSNALCLLSGGQQCVHLLAMFLSTWLGYLNSSLNPLIYTVFDKRFRKAFRDLLACCLGPTGGGGLNRGGGARARQR